jgi:hypothetical protein
MAICLLLPFIFSQVEAKTIRLRNQLVNPGSASAVPLAKVTPAGSPVSGLFLIQVSSTLTPEARAELAEAGVDLLHSVPEDSFVARIRGGRLDQIRAFPFVTWVGDYRPEFRIHPALGNLPTAKLGNASVSATVLLEPRASAAEIAAVRAAFGPVRQESTLRAGVVLRGELSSSRLASLAATDAVLWIEPAPKMKLVDEVASKIVAGDGGHHQSLAQQLGYDGRGVAVAVADSGLDNGDAASMHPDLLGRTPAFFYYGTLTDAADEHSHGTHVAGIVAGNGATGEVDDNDALYGLGVAPGASIIAQRIFDADGLEQLPPSFEKLTRDATRAGAVVGSNSWGDDTQGRYDVTAMEFDELVRDADALALGDQPYILEFSAGNAGPGSQTMDSPAVAKNVIATGASENDREDFIIYADGPDVIADFSSRGPCEDGRIKPDICAPGTWISSLQSASATDQYAWSPIDSLYQYQGGTSQAGPHASGAAAVFVQYYRETHANATPSPALVKAALINAATEMYDPLSYEPVPNMNEGWGRVDLVPLLDPSLTFIFVDQTSPLTNLAVFERHVLITGPDQSLKATLTYTDVPGFPGALQALINDLDLEVIAPDGTLYRGNQFNAGESVRNAAAGDRINNVEGVFLGSPIPGEYIIRVRAVKVVEDARVDTAAVDQDFALVISGAVAVPSVGSVSLDRNAYTVPDRVKIVVIDTDQAGQPSVNVLAQSTTETNAETVVLAAATTSGVFTGSVATATGSVIKDGRLQVVNGDGIQVTYFDASGNATRSATARADLVPPVLSGVASSAGFGLVAVSWSSDEPATSVLYYGTNSSMSGQLFVRSDSELTTTHSIDVAGLTPGQTYYFYVASSDEAGNTSTNNNAGKFFSFVPATSPTVLLVDEYQDDFFGAPPISGYTDPLDQIGIGYDVWDASIRGAPTLTNLQPYRVVVWRVSELLGVWSATERTAISNYLAGGGALFVASMEILSRLDSDGAADFIHNVLHVGSYLTDETGSSGAAEIIGSAYAPVGTGLDIVMDYSVYENLWGGLLGPDLSDILSPGTNAVAILQNDFGDNVGLCYPAAGRPNPGRVVFCTFPLDAAPLQNGVNDRANLLRNALAFLAPGAPGLPSLTLDSPAYRLPAKVGVQVGDADLAGKGTISAHAWSTTATNPISFTLVETAQRGVFFGSFDLVPFTNSPAVGQVPARSNDTVQVQYMDSSVGLALNASAAVDTTPPEITDVVPDPSYQEAYIYWDTSEAADALVQFGESPRFLNRTAYDSTPATFHAVTLQGLLPNSTYYYQVVSRDLAGNTTVDDNRGKFYTFNTLVPLQPPWSDDMDSGASDWSVYSVDGSQVEWTLGIPNNHAVTEAHSPPNCWGSNLNGEGTDTVESFLISPALYLTNGNVATLTFWHWYDFSDPNGIDIIHGGEVDIVTDKDGATTPIASFADASGGWVQEEVDLSPYIGQIVYLAWHYVLFSLETSVRPGWLVDDVEVSMSSVQPGVVTISNNISQATYVLSGPTYLKDKGFGTALTNAPPGDYVIEFADVPFYFTPPSQTNVLTAGTIIHFSGNYTFPDANTNGISDLWETNYFSSVSPSRTPLTDTDQDGMTDYEEFIAGTNPTNPQSNLQVTTQVFASGPVNLKWQGVSGRSYVVEGSSDANYWTPISGWIVAPTTTILSYPLPPTSPGGAYLFRVQVRP